MNSRDVEAAGHVTMCPCEQGGINYLWSMEFLVSVPKDKAKLMQGLLESISFAKVLPLTKDKTQRVSNMLEAIAELNEIKLGRRKAVPMKQVLDEL